MKNKQISDEEVMLVLFDAQEKAKNILSDLTLYEVIVLDVILQDLKENYMISEQKILYVKVYK